MHTYRLDYSYDMHHSDEYDTIANYILEMGRDELEFESIYHYENTYGELEFRAGVIIQDITVIHYTIDNGALTAIIDVTYDITKRGEL